MKGGGKYIRVWVYGANAKYLEDVDNQSRTVNEALAMYSQTQAGNITVPITSSGSTSNGTVFTLTPSARSSTVTTTFTATQPVKLTCDNGHLLNAVTGKCVGKACEYATLPLQTK